MQTNLYIFSNGNNDLSYYVQASYNKLRNALNDYSSMSIFGAFTYKDIDENRLWTNYPLIYNENNDNISFSYCNHTFNTYCVDQFCTVLNSTTSYLDIRKFLTYFSCSTNYTNIVVLSGHGGLFQSFLDLSKSSPFALNTIKLCNDLKQFPIDLLILDMCSMNYIEIAYELLKNSGIENIIFFKGLAPLEGLDLVELCNIIDQHDDDIEIIISNILSIKKYSLFSISNNSVDKLDIIKMLLDKIAFNILTHNAPKNVYLNEHLKILLENLVIEGDLSSKIPGLPLKFIGYELNEFDEKLLYRCYKFSMDSYWGNIVSKGVFIHHSFNPPEIIPFTKENLKHLILIHNPTLSQDSLDDLFNSSLRLYANI